MRLPNKLEARIAEVYGGKRGLYHHIVTTSKVYLGGMRAARTIHWQSVQRLVFICQGNICRSAYAEAKARSLGCATASAGLSVAEPASSPLSAQSVAQLRGLDLSNHRSTSVKKLKLSDGDLLIAMEPRHINELQVLLKNSPVQMTLIGLWCSSIGQPRRK